MARKAEKRSGIRIWDRITTKVNQFCGPAQSSPRCTKCAHPSMASVPTSYYSSGTILTAALQRVKLFTTRAHLEGSQSIINWTVAGHVSR